MTVDELKKELDEAYKELTAASSQTIAKFYGNNELHTALQMVYEDIGRCMMSITDAIIKYEKNR